MGKYGFLLELFKYLHLYPFFINTLPEKVMDSALLILRKSYIRYVQRLIELLLNLMANSKQTADTAKISVQVRTTAHLISNFYPTAV